MGYRSDVYIGLRKEAYIKHVILLDSFPKLLRDLNNPAQMHNDIYYWSISHIKWYDSYKNVAEVTDFLNVLYEETSDTDKELYGFIRIGEEDNDIESSGFPWELDMQLQRYVEMPYSEI